MSFGKTFEQQKKRFEKNLKRARGIAGNSAVRHFRDSFRNEGFTDNGLEKWTEVQRRIPDTLAYETATGAARTRGILRKTGRLSKSIKVIKSTQYTVVIGVEGVPYAPYHNEGAKWTQRSIFGRPLKQPIQVEIPKRQFIGNSKKLESEITKRLGEAWAQS
jgi:phage gpG-like protein